MRLRAPAVHALFLLVAVGDYVWALHRDGDGAWRLVWWIFTRQPPTRSS